MKKWFKRQPKIVKINMGDQLDIYVLHSTYHLRLTEISSDLQLGTTAIFTDVNRERNYKGIQ